MLWKPFFFLNKGLVIILQSVNDMQYQHVLKLWKFLKSGQTKQWTIKCIFNIDQLT